MSLGSSSIVHRRPGMNKDRMEGKFLLNGFVYVEVEFRQVQASPCIFLKVEDLVTPANECAS